LLRPLFWKYFRGEVSGVSNVPETGSALLVANHSGTVPIDSAMLALAMHDETPSHRHLRLLGADLIFRIPMLSELARKSGGTLACNPDAERLLSTGELVGVFPEGFKGVGIR
jgi:1-acyl-sn-glycerol-3-phosphate acyltransferase